MTFLHWGRQWDYRSKDGEWLTHLMVIHVTNQWKRKNHFSSPIIMTEQRRDVPGVCDWFLRRQYVSVASTDASFLSVIDRVYLFGFIPVRRSVERLARDASWKTLLIWGRWLGLGRGVGTLIGNAGQGLCSHFYDWYFLDSSSTQPYYCLLHPSFRLMTDWSWFTYCS